MKRVLSLVLVPVLVVVLLLSVIIPALEMQRVMRLLREISVVIEPQLSGEMTRRLEEVARHEIQSVFINAVLVTVALAAIAVVVALSRRERRLAAVLESRVMSETALREKLERVMQSRQRLMRGFSHDVKNPLGAADGYADLLSTGIYGDMADRQKETLGRIRRSIRRALGLIDDLHELARIDTGNITLHPEQVDLQELANTNVDEYRGAAYAAGLPLTLEFTPDLPSVETDGARVRQIVGNLLSNAIKYTATGSIVLRVRPYPATAPPSLADCVDIDVIDTGRGIPGDKQEIIFEEFSRMDVNDRPGAGLGLAISQRLATALGGHIFVKSEERRGSTFTLRIPVHINA